MTDPSGSTRYCHDRRGNIARKVQAHVGGPTFTVVNTYTAADRLATVTYPSGASVTFQRDAAGRISGVLAKPTATAAQVTLVSAVAYLPFGPLSTVTFGNGRVLTKAFDQNYGIDSVADNASGGLSLDFTLDALGRVTGIDERLVNGSIATRSVDYDGQDRLAALKDGTTVVQGFTYDATGNRLTKVEGGVTANYTYPSTSHRLTKAGTQPTRTLDATGNPTVIATKTFTYSDHGRLAQTANSGVIQRTYLLNGKGERVGNVGDTAKYLVFDEAGHVLGEYNSGGTRIWEYVWMDDTLVAVLGNHDGSTYQFVLTDHLGTPRAVVQPGSNAIIWRWDLTQSAFGDHTAQNNPDGNSKSYMMDLRYPGQYYDNETGFHYNYFRDYDPGTGRYLQSDPIGLAGGVSTYGYVGGSPLRHIDPFGLEIFAIHSSGVPGGQKDNGHAWAAMYADDGSLIGTWGAWSRGNARLPDDTRAKQRDPNCDCNDVYRNVEITPGNEYVPIASFYFSVSPQQARVFYEFAREKFEHSAQNNCATWLEGGFESMFPEIDISFNDPGAYFITETPRQVTAQLRSWKDRFPTNSLRNPLRP